MTATRPGYYLGENRILTVTDRGDRMYLDTQDIMLTPGVLCWGAWEPETTAIFERLLRPGMTWVDVGANVGYFTIIGHKLVAPGGGRTFAFEANPRTHAFLNDNVRLNWFFDHMTVEQKAVYRQSQKLSFSAPEKYNVNASIAAFEPGNWERVLDRVDTFDVDAVSLDDYFPDARIDFCKVDVEGAEAFVLEGARALIARNPQLQWLLEWSPHQMLQCGSSPAALCELIQALGLECRASDLDASPLSPHQLLEIHQTTMVHLKHR
jgi:FkbM family methyltransferase